MREVVKALCEPVEPPKNTPAYLHYFCAQGMENSFFKDLQHRANV
jgi:type I restriction enzyme R subunit